MPVDYPGAIDMLLPHSYTFNSVAPLSIVEHCTGGDMTIESVHATFLATMRSTHFAVGRDGRVAQFVELNRGAGGNCCPQPGYNPYWQPYITQYINLNLCTISIEHCNGPGNNLPLTPAQQDASNKLNLWLCNRFGITTPHIHSHQSIDPPTNCPGPKFDFNQLFKYIAGANMNTEQAIVDAFLANNKEMQRTFPEKNIPTLRTNTGIFDVYRRLFLSGVQLGSADGDEYTSVTSTGSPIIYQQFGSYRIGFIPSVGPNAIYGPTKIALP
jgi:N-acetyl-anhydromuramyl-L-alanine amidase AmpD